MSTPARRLRAGLVVLLLAGLVTADDVEIRAQGQGARQTPLVVPEAIVAALDAAGEVPVIIGVATARPFQTDSLLAVADAAVQRADIAAAQDRLIAELATAGLDGVSRFQTIPFVSGRINATLLDALRASPLVTSIEEDRQLAPTLLESIRQVGADTAWASGYMGSGWTVAVLDTGVDKTHPFLAGKVVSEACYSNAAGGGGGTTVCPGGVTASVAVGSGVPCGSDCDHGTHVAGIAAGAGATFGGVARGASIIAVQVFTRFPTGLSSFTSDFVRGLERVYALRGTFNVAAVNLSLGGGRYFSTCDGASASAKAAIDTLRGAGIAVVAASGNDGWSDSMGFPACISSAISVGSVGDGSFGAIADRVSGFSNTPPFVHLLAPGQWIYSSVLGGNFDNFQGTSMATPHVAGAIAVLKQRRPGASVTELLTALRSTGATVRHPVTGVAFPRINVAAALSGNCDYTVTPTSASFTASANTGVVFVSAGAGCAWTASSNSSWLTITAGLPGVSDGTVTYSVARNSGAARVGNLTVAGVMVSVSQAARVIMPPFTDDPLTTSHSMRAVHVMELRARVDALRASVGLAAVLWTDPVLTPGVTVAKAVHLSQLRAALGDVYAALGRPAPVYTDPAVVAGLAIRRLHIVELRAAVVAAED